MSGKGKLSNSSLKSGQKEISGTSGNDIEYLTTSSYNYNSAYTYNAFAGNDVVYGSSYSVILNATENVNVDSERTSHTPVESILGGQGNDWINAGGGYKTVYTWAQDDGVSTGDHTFSYNRADFMDGGSGPNGNDTGSDWVSFQPFGSPNGSGRVIYNDQYQHGVYIDLSDTDGDNYKFGLNADSYDSEDAADYAIGTANNFENVWGSNSNDFIIGSDVNNNLKGADGDDEIDGGDGDDEITGGRGTDRLTGGLGADKFKFELGDSGKYEDDDELDTITDYSYDDGDEIHADFTFDTVILDGELLTFSNGESEIMSINVSSSPETIRVNGVDYTNSGDGGGGGGGFTLTNHWFDNLYEETINFPTEAVLWEYWGLTLDAVKTEYNWDGIGGIGSDSTDPYFILDATFIYQGTGLPTYTNSDISSVTLYENSTNASYDIDLFGLAEVTRVDDVFVTYSLIATEGSGPITYSDIGVGDYLTVNLTGGTSFQIQHYDVAFPPV